MEMELLYIDFQQAFDSIKKKTDERINKWNKYSNEKTNIDDNEKQIIAYAYDIVFAKKKRYRKKRYRC